MAPVLQRLAMNYPPILAHAINTITAYKGQVIYDTPATEAKAQTYTHICSGFRLTAVPRHAWATRVLGALLLPPNPVPGPPPPAQPYRSCSRQPRPGQQPAGHRRRDPQRPVRSRPRESRRCSRGRGG